MAPVYRRRWTEMGWRARATGLGAGGELPSPSPGPEASRARTSSPRTPCSGGGWAGLSLSAGLSERPFAAEGVETAAPRPQPNGRGRAALPGREAAGGPAWRLAGRVRGARGRGRGAGTCAQAARPARGARAPCLNEPGLPAPATSEGLAPRPQEERPVRVSSLAPARLGSGAVDGTERRGAGGGARRGARAARESAAGLGHGGLQDLSPAPRGGSLVAGDGDRAGLPPRRAVSAAPPPPPRRRLGPSRSAGPLGNMALEQLCAVLKGKRRGPRTAPPAGRGRRLRVPPRRPAPDAPLCLVRADRGALAPARIDLLSRRLSPSSLRVWQAPGGTGGNAR